MTLALLLVLPLAGPCEPAAVHQQPVQEKGEEIERLKEWPDLGSAKEAVRTDIARLRKARTPGSGNAAQRRRAKVRTGTARSSK